MCYTIHMNDILAAKLRQLPTDAGVYIYYDDSGNILYVGKAKNLRNRVRQYFAPSTDKSDKVLAMLSHVVDLRYIITTSESDALSLENTLIKQHTPPYNILLKDDKQYPYIKVDVASPYPRIEVTRKLERDKARYFGPITSGGSRAMMELLGRLFPTITCRQDIEHLPRNFRPCLNAHIGRCCAPCIGKVTQQQYRDIIDSALQFLGGDTATIRAQLEQSMTEASANMQYEQALTLRDSIATIDKMRGRHITVLSRVVDYDMLAISANGRQSVVCHMMIRSGKVVFSDNFAVSDAAIEEEQTWASFLLDYCPMANISKELYTNIPLGDSDIIAQLVAEQVGHGVTVSCPQRGDKKKLIDMAHANALEYLTKCEDDIQRQYNSTVGAVTQLQQLLGLRTLPKRIECYDISNISGVDKVSSMVVMTNGQRDNKNYRRFMIRTVEGANDFASMAETLSRRVMRLDDQRFGAVPDLIVIDGGLGQLEYARRALGEHSKDIALVSLAKREELVYVLGSSQPIVLPRNSYALRLLINIRDEAHRFAITYFRQLHGKNALKSMLSEIQGIGDKRLKALQRHYKSIDDIRSASIEQLSQIVGINSSVASNIYEFFHPVSAEPVD